MDPLMNGDRKGLQLGLLNDAVKLRKKWGAKGARWPRWQFYTLLASIILSVCVATFGEMMSKYSLIYGPPLNGLAIAGALNAICIAALNSFNMGTRATDVRQATRMLDNAIRKYRYTDISEADFIAAIAEAQETMGHPQFEFSAEVKAKS